MVDSGYSTENYKSLKVSIGAINSEMQKSRKNLKMLRFLPGHLKAKKMCKNAVKKLLIDRKPRKGVINLFENGRTLMFAPD